MMMIIFWPFGIHVILVYPLLTPSVVWVATVWTPDDPVHSTAMGVNGCPRMSMSLHQPVSTGVHWVPVEGRRGEEREERRGDEGKIFRNRSLTYQIFSIWD